MCIGCGFVRSTWQNASQHSAGDLRQVPPPPGTSRTASSACSGKSRPRPFRLSFLYLATWENSSGRLQLMLLLAGQESLFISNTWATGRIPSSRTALLTRSSRYRVREDVWRPVVAAEAAQADPRSRRKRERFPDHAFCQMASLDQVMTLSPNSKGLSPFSAFGKCLPSVPSSLAYGSSGSSTPKPHSAHQ